MRQSSVTSMKQNGLDPVEWCTFTEDWIPLLAETRAHLNQQRIAPGSGLGQFLLNKAAVASACPAYLWRTRVFPNPSDFHRQQAVWSDWVTAVRSVIFIDGEIPTITGSGPSVRVSLRLPETLAARQRIR